MLVCKDDNGVDQTYALKISNVGLFNSKIYSDLKNPSLTGITTEDKKNELENMLKNDYKKDINSERAFLQFFKDYNISLYKADATGNNFNKLTLADPNSSTSAVNQTPCNEFM
jgi:hypothetical protein